MYCILWLIAKVLNKCNILSLIFTNHHIDNIVQDCSVSSANAMDLF